MSIHYYYQNSNLYPPCIAPKFVVGLPTADSPTGPEFLESTPFSILLSRMPMVCSFVSNFPIVSPLMTLISSIGLFYKICVSYSQLRSGHVNYGIAHSLNSLIETSYIGPMHFLIAQYDVGRLYHAHRRAKILFCEMPPRLGIDENAHPPAFDFHLICLELYRALPNRSAQIVFGIRLISFRLRCLYLVVLLGFSSFRLSKYPQRAEPHKSLI